MGDGGGGVSPDGSGEGRLTRREVLKGTAALGVGFALRGSAAGEASPAGMQSIDLGGETWIVREDGKRGGIPARIPGSTYTALLAAGKIPDPFYGENNDQVQWVAEKDWVFERSFEVPDALRRKRHVELVCHGLDTLATVWLNGQRIGSADNMFRTWNFDIRPYLRRGTNRIRIHFRSLASYVQERRSAYKEAYGIDLSNERSWVRKAPYMWGWDWCRPILTQGIWKKIEILGYDVRISDLWVAQNHLEDGSVSLETSVAVEGAAEGATVKLEVSLAGNRVAEVTAAVLHNAAFPRISVPRPQLWWPNGMGSQPLYLVTARLIDARGREVSAASRRIGLRTVAVFAPDGDRSMHVSINGTPVFAKGVDWIPADNMPTRVTPAILRWYMSQAARSNFNFIRLWGGGYYEEDELFDLCDELGLMLQFEFKFANTSYPVHDSNWISNLRVEVDQQARRCRNHPSIVIWSGNNEIAYFQGYNRLFGEVIGGAVHELVPGAFYEVGSGASGSGDIHSWGVWHQNQPVESYRKVEGFVTEFGMQSTPVPATVNSFTDAADRGSIDSATMRYHELDGSGDGVGIIMHYTEANFGRAPESFDDTLWLTQVNQSWAMKYGVEHWRRSMPRSMAALIWQYNDCWPCLSWSMVDYDRRFKAVMYQAKHFFAPILVSGVAERQTGKVALYVTSDLPRNVRGKLQWSATDAAGNLLRQGTEQSEITSRSSRLVQTLDLSDLVKQHGAQNLLVFASLVVAGRQASRNTIFFGRPKDLKLGRPHLTTHVSGGERQYRVVIESDMPALWLWANVKDTEASYSDNFVDLRPGHARKIGVTLTEPMAPFDFQTRLEVRSIYDLAQDMRG